MSSYQQKEISLERVEKFIKRSPKKESEKITTLLSGSRVIIQVGNSFFWGYTQADCRVKKIEKPESINAVRFRNALDRVLRGSKDKGTKQDHGWFVVLDACCVYHYGADSVKVGNGTPMYVVDKVKKSKTDRIRS